MPLHKFHSHGNSLCSRTAICRGAIYRGFLDAERSSNGGDEQGMKGINVESPISVASTISRMSIGTTFYDKYDPSVHSKDELEWNSDEGEDVATNQTRWYLKKACGFFKLIHIFY
jgi:hypothetical protein